LIRSSYPDFGINPHSDQDVCRIALEMWIHYLVGVNHFANCCDNLPVSGGDCMRNSNKYPKMPYTTMVREVEK